MVIQLAVFTRLQLSSYLCLNSLPTKYCSYSLTLISICGHFPTVNNRFYGHCYIKKSYTTVYFPWILHLSRGNFSKIVQNFFYRCSRALNVMFLKTSYFWWMLSIFSLSSHLKLAYLFLGDYQLIVPQQKHYCLNRNHELII